jgi:hypothetical protein
MHHPSSDEKNEPRQQPPNLTKRYCVASDSGLASVHGTNGRESLISVKWYSTRASQDSYIVYGLNLHRQSTSSERLLVEFCLTVEAVAGSECPANESNGF